MSVAVAEFEAEFRSATWLESLRAPTDFQGVTTPVVTGYHTDASEAMAPTRPPKQPKPKAQSDATEPTPTQVRPKKPPARKPNIVKSGNAGSSKPVEKVIELAPGQSAPPPPLFRECGWQRTELANIRPCTDLPDSLAALSCWLQDSSELVNRALFEKWMGQAFSRTKEAPEWSVSSSTQVSTHLHCYASGSRSKHYAGLTLL